jgi:hypothetical protein
MPISKEDIAQDANRLVTAWVFPHETDETPDDLTLERAKVLHFLLVQRMTELVARNVNPIGMSIQDLLPDIDPGKLEVDDPC